MADDLLIPKFGWVRRLPWLYGLLNIALVLVFLLSLNTKSWLYAAPSLLWFALGGIFFAYLLGRSRWRGIWCLGYSLVLVLVAACQQIGELIPAPGSMSMMAWLEQLNWQILLILERCTIWVETAMAQKPIHDAGWQQFLLIFQAWMGPAWLVWILQRRGQVWLAALPMLIWMSVPIQNGYTDSLSLLAALFLVLCLSALQVYKKLHNDWQAQLLDYPDGLWQDWLAAILIMSMLVLPIAHAAPLVTTPEGWQKIESWYDEIRTTAERGQTQPSNESRPASISSGSSLDRQLSGPDLSLVGVPLPENDRLAMWIRVGDPTPRPWRTTIYATYTGTGWLEAPLLETPVDSLEEPLQAPLGSKILKQNFIIVGSFNGNLFAAGEPVRVVGEDVSLRAVLPDGSNVLRGEANRYEVWSLVPNIRPENLSQSGVDYPAEILETYLQLPPALPLRVFTLARRLVSGHPNTLDKVVAVQTYLRGAVPYDLNTPLPAEGQDAVDYFLFEAQSGFCSYYASSMAVLLRTLGIPARVVTGYGAGTYILQQGYFQVPGTSAHAWVEVYFPDFGWIPFEPTPSEEVPYYARIQTVIEPPEPVSRQSAVRQLFWLRLGFGLLLAALGIGAGILGFRTWKTQRRIARQSGHPQVRQYLMLCYRLQRAGFGILATQTLREVLATLGPQLTDYPRILKALQSTTMGVECVLYGFRPMDEAEIRTMRAAVRACWRDWLRLGWMGKRKYKKSFYR